MRYPHWLLGGLAMLALAACGGGGGPIEPGPTPTDPIVQDEQQDDPPPTQRAGLAAGETGLYFSVVLSRGTSTNCPGYGIPCTRTVETNEALVFYSLRTRQFEAIQSDGKPAQHVVSTRRGLWVGPRAGDWRLWDVTRNAAAGTQAFFAPSHPWSVRISGDYALWYVKGYLDAPNHWHLRDVTGAERNEGKVDMPAYSAFFGDNGHWYRVYWYDAQAGRAVPTTIEEWDPVRWAPTGRSFLLPRSRVGRTLDFDTQHIYLTADGDDVYLVKHSQRTRRSDRLEIYRHDGRGWTLVRDEDLADRPAGWKGSDASYLNPYVDGALDIHRGKLLFHGWDKGVLFLDLDSGERRYIEIDLEIQSMAVYHNA